MTAFKRKVFYLSGFDPRGARFYHELLAEQVSLADHLRLGARRREGPDASWHLTRSDDATDCAVHFLAWDDLVRRHWPRGAASLLAKLAAAYARFLTRGRWSQTSAVPRGSKLALAFPGLMLAGIALPMALLVGLVSGAGFLALGWPWWLAVIPALIVAALVAVPVAERGHGLWLARFVIFNDALARARAGADLDARLDAFAARLAEAMGEDCDELLFVTHSNGSILAVPVMARLLDRVGTMPAHFALVTLGSSIPLVGFRRDASAFHAALDRVAMGDFAWLDIGSLTDGAAIPLVDPCLTRPARPRRLIQKSPRWHLYCDPSKYRARRSDKYLVHFDYLRRLDRASALDFLSLLTAPQPLARSIAAFEAEND